jgi:hypothetical protein
MVQEIPIVKMGGFGARRTELPAAQRIALARALVKAKLLLS